MPIVEAIIQDGVSFGGDSIARQKIQFAYMHLLAARDAAVEAQRAGLKDLAQDGEARNVLLKSVPVAIVMAAAALEANANEVIQERLEERSGGAAESLRKLLEDLRDDRTGNSIDKYRRLALLLGTVPDEGTANWENAKVLVRFRNFFMHMRPSWDDDDVHRCRLAEQMRARVRAVECYREIFPHGVLNFECAKWAIDTVRNFSAEYAQVISARDVFALNDADFNLR